MTVGLVLADMGWGSHMGDWGAGWWILMTLLMVAFWGLVIVGIVWLVRSAAVGHRGGGTAIEVLDHRLAGGEISPEEYRRSRDTLTDGSTPDSPDSSREGERGP